MKRKKKTYFRGKTCGKISSSRVFVDTIARDFAREEKRNLERLDSSKIRTWEEQLKFDITFDPKRNDWKNIDQWWKYEKEKNYRGKV